MAGIAILGALYRSYASMSRRDRVPTGPWQRLRECRRSGRLLAVVVDLLELGVDHTVAALLPRLLTARGSTPGRLGLGLVHGLAKLHGDLRQGIGLGLDRLGILALKHTLEIGHRLFDRRLVGSGHLVAVFLEALLGRVDQAVSVVPGFDDRLALLVLLGMLGSLTDHLLDLGLRKTARSLDADLLLLAGRLVLGRDVDDAVGVDVERDLDLGHAAWCRRNPHQVE